MTKRAPDWWLSAWDEYGELFRHRPDRADHGGRSGAGERSSGGDQCRGRNTDQAHPDAVARFQESVDWAVDEHRAIQFRTNEAADTGADCEPEEPVMTEMQREAQREALRLIEAKKPTDRIDYALFYLQASVGRFLVGRDIRDDLAWHHEVAQELANLTDHEITTRRDQ